MSLKLVRIATVLAGIILINNVHAAASVVPEPKSTATNVAPVAATTAYQSIKFPTFKEWLTVMKQLPKFYDLAAKGVLQAEYTVASNYQYSAFAKNPVVAINSQANPCDFSELAQAIQAYFNLENTGLLHSASNWVGNNLPPASFFDPQQAYFKTPPAPFLPFAQKLNLPKGSTVILRADIHGDGISFAQQIEDLQKQKYMDPVDGFKLANAQTYMLFLGDYADRGLYGAEVMYTILRLKLANPTQVFMTRGNHEDIKMVAKQGFMTELQVKFGQLDFSDIYRVYEYLPAVIYLGCGHDYYQCCHGGLEVGYNPTNLLNAVEALKFELLGELKQLDFLANPIPQNRKIGQHFQTMMATCGDCGAATCPDCDDAIGVNPYSNIFANFTPVAPVGPLDGRLIGFLQHDFLVEDTTASHVSGILADKNNSKSATATKSHQKLSDMGLGAITEVVGGDTIFVGYLKNRRMLCSRSFTQLVLQALSSGTNQIRAVIRGHQHGANPKGHMMAGLISNYGVFSLWPSDIGVEQGTTRLMKDYLVHTFLVAPDNIYGVSNKFNFDTFAILKLSDYATDQMVIMNTVISTTPPVVPVKSKKGVKKSKAPAVLTKTA